MKNKSTVSSQQSVAHDGAPLRACLGRWLRRHAAAIHTPFGRDVLDEYLEFHMVQNTLAYAHREGRIRAVAVAWQCWEDEILAAHEAGAQPFRWRMSNPEGDAIFIANVTALEPVALAGVMLALSRRFPQWSILKLYTYRRADRLTMLLPTQLQRLYERALHESGI